MVENDTHMSDSHMQVCSVKNIKLFENYTHRGYSYLWLYFVKFIMFVNSTNMSDSNMQACSVKNVKMLENNTYWGYSYLWLYFVKFIMFVKKQTLGCESAL